MQCAQTLLRVKTEGNVCVRPDEVDIQQNIMCVKNDALPSWFVLYRRVCVPQAVEVRRLYKTFKGIEI